MSSPSPARLRAFVRRHARPTTLPDLPGIRLWVADDVMTVCRLAGAELGQVDPPLPFWAFPWAGGLAVARYIEDHPDVVAGRRVLDVASGSGLCAIAALRAGAASADAVDVDPLAEAALAVNARANGVRVGFARQDVRLVSPAAWDVVLAGDVCYEEAMAERMLDWLGRAASGGARVLLGDPGRRYFPPGLVRLATYEVRTSRELEHAEVTASAVFTFPAGA